MKVVSPFKFESRSLTTLVLVVTCINPDRLTMVNLPALFVFMSLVKYKLFYELCLIVACIE